MLSGKLHYKRNHKHVITAGKVAEPAEPLEPDKYQQHGRIDGGNKSYLFVVCLAHPGIH